MFRKLFILILTVNIFVVDISYSQAKADFVKTTFYFGQIEEGAIAVHQFTFFNNRGPTADNIIGKSLLWLYNT